MAKQEKSEGAGTSGGVRGAGGAAGEPRAQPAGRARGGRALRSASTKGPRPGLRVPRHAVAFSGKNGNSDEAQSQGVCGTWITETNQ